MLSHGCRNSVDYRLFEKRFIFRQLLSIYDSRVSDLETKTQILNILLAACRCKYSLVDLIKRHYLLVWMTSVLEKNSTRAVQNEAGVKIFHKLIQIFILIWQQLGSNRIVKASDGLTEQSLSPPLTFLNQMFVLTKLFLEKLISLNSRLNEIKLEFTDDKNTEASNTESAGFCISLGKCVVKRFFKARKEIVNNLSKYELNMAAFSAQTSSLDNELQRVEEFSYEAITNLLESRKRSCFHLDSEVVREKRIRTQ